MEMGSKVFTFVFVFGFALSVFLHHAAAQTMHTVGDTTGWTVPPGGAVFYSNWAADKTFVVGDSLVFNFPTNAHDVQRVNMQSFNECNDENEIGDLIITGPATINLTAAGEHYYICTIGRHCLGGQKLSITVSATRGAMPPSSNTPRPPTKISPSTDAACPPEGPPPSTGGPQPRLISPPGSSAHAVVAAVSTTLFGLVLSLF